MLQEERHNKILELLDIDNTVRISKLSESLGVTRQTIRRDLYELEKEGYIKKIHGGAILNRTSVEPSFSNRLNTSVDEKEWIAKKATDLVADGDAIFLDIGTTTLMMAKTIAKLRKKLTVITNALPIAIELAKAPEIKVIVSGGELRGGELSLSGPISTRSLQDLYVDKAFIGVGGISIEGGYTDYHLGESELRRLMIKHAKESYALADHSKMNINAIYKTVNLQDIDILITDEKSPKYIINELQKMDVEVITVSQEHE